MTNAAVPSSLLPTESHTCRPPLSSMLFCPPHIPPLLSYIYSLSLNTLMTPFLCPHSSLLFVFLTPSFYPDCSSPPLSLSVSHRGSAIENLHMIVINDFDLFARLFPPPPFTPSLSHPFSAQQPAAKWPKCLH